MCRCEGAEKAVTDLSQRLSATQAELAEAQTKSDAQGTELERLRAVVAEHERVRTRDAKILHAANAVKHTPQQQTNGADEWASGADHGSARASAAGTGVWATMTTSPDGGGGSESSALQRSSRGSLRASGGEPHRITLEGMFDNIVRQGLHVGVHRVAGVAFPAATYSVVATMQFVSDQELRSPTPYGMRAAGTHPT